MSRTSGPDRPAFRPSRRGVLLAGGLLALAGCVPTTSRTAVLLPGPGPATPALEPALPGETLGPGPVRVALLAAQSGEGIRGQIGVATRNAADLALRDFATPGISVSVIDSRGTAEGAAAAAQTAVAAGAELILGPFFAEEVRGAAPIAQAAGIPVISFSSDPSVAGPGVFVMGVLADTDIGEIVRHAAAQGRRSMAALIGETQYGVLAEAAFRQHAAAAGARIVSVQRSPVDPGSIQAAAGALAANRDQIDAILIPDGPGVADVVGQALLSAGVVSGQTMLLGSGQWNAPSLFSNPTLVGGRFPAPDIEAFRTFATAYSTAYGSAPPPNVALVYDAVTLAAALGRQAGPNRYDPAVIADPQGALSRISGLFRFLPNGLNERRLAIYEVTTNGPRQIAPAPRAFGTV